MLKNTNFIDKLRDAGLRPTKQRVKICEILFNREKTFHFTINDLAKKISEDFNEKISLGYSYDLNTSKLNGYNSGGHELVLSIGLNKRKELQQKEEEAAE